jgi:TatD DNase family protein
MLINIHSHKTGTSNGFVIENRFRNFADIGQEGYWSAGLHPWYITEADYLNEFEELKQVSQKNNVLAIGECGLDKTCTTDFTLQQTVFAAQIEWANHINKPLIIHCVRAYAEVQQILQQQQNAVPVIFHGFNKNAILAQELIGKGYYLSFGKALQQPALQHLLSTLPIDKIFLETDDADISIASVYEYAAQAFQIDINSLSLQIQKNAATVFGANRF